MADKKPKQYIIDNSALMAEWHWEKNTEFDPTKITLGSTIKPWWICSRNHEWQAIIGNRSKGHGCPFCAGLYVIVGENDLNTSNLIAEKSVVEMQGRS